MTRKQAELIAEGLGAGTEAYETGVNFWVVGKQTADGYLVIGPECISEYISKARFLDGDSPVVSLTI